MLGLLPLTDIAITTSPGRIRVRSWYSNTNSYPESFAKEVTESTLSVSDSIRNGGNPLTNVFGPRSLTNVDAIAELPPLPIVKIVLSLVAAVSNISIVLPMAAESKALRMVAIRFAYPAAYSVPVADPSNSFLS